MLGFGAVYRGGGWSSFIFDPSSGRPERRASPRPLATPGGPHFFAISLRDQDLGSSITPFTASRIHGVIASCCKMSKTNATAALWEENVLKRKSDDVGWEYGSLVDPSKLDKVKCMFCNHVITGGVYRLKQHVAHVGNAVVKCKKSPQEAKDRCKKSLEEAYNKRREKTARELELRESVNISRVGDEVAMRILSLTSSDSGCKRNWSTFENIHTIKRNRLTTDRLNSLVFVQFNSRMMAKKQVIKEKKIADVLLSTETTEAQGFLFEGGDECAVVVYMDEDEEELDSTIVSLEKQSKLMNSLSHVEEQD